MAVAIVQGKVGSNTGNVNVNTTTFDSAAGTGIICGYAIWVLTAGQGTDTISTITDNQGNTGYVLGTASTRAGTVYDNIYVQPFYKIGPIAGVTAVTVTWASAKAGSSYVVLHELGSGVFDQQVQTNGNSSAPVSGTLTVPTGAAAIAAVLIEDGFGGPPKFTAGSGWTILHNNGGGSQEDATEYRSNASGSITGDYTYSSSAGPWVGSMITFIDPAITGVRIGVGT